jgi:predicted aspartyl protease
MDSNPFFVNIGINNTSYTYALVDSGCLTYATMSQVYANKLRLPRIEIKPRALETVNGVIPDAITAVTYAGIDIDGYKRNRLFFYIIPDQTEDVILGKTWMAEDDVTIRPAKNSLHIGAANHTVNGRNPDQKEDHSFIRQQMASVFAALIRRRRKQKSSPNRQVTQIFAASLADIEKALAPKKRPDIKALLPKEYHKFLDVFDPD